MTGKTKEVYLYESDRSQQYLWKLINKLIKETDAQVIAPAYRRLPFATWREAFDFIVPLYREYCETHPDQKIVLMGDSAGAAFPLHWQSSSRRMEYGCLMS